ncbi:hypothetical protein F5888DRAFT_1061729 [Russula emetica]|nr:hypothetical protein F5888DRAFT_1061729 [Russula emetica]
MLTTYSLAAALLFASPLPAAAQISYPTCSTSWSWSFNSLGQNPCAVTAHLQSVCNNGEFSVPSLIPGDVYSAPSDSKELPCVCSTVVYSLVSACGACQNSFWLTWNAWTVNCSAVDPPSTFSKTIPNGTKVPAWAFLDVTGGTWNPVLSYQVGDSPEVSGGTSASKYNDHHSNKTAAIVGGVLGGIVFIVLTIVLMLWRQRIKRRRATRAAAASILSNRAVPLQDKVSKRNQDDPPPDNAI